MLMYLRFALDLTAKAQSAGCWEKSAFVPPLAFYNRLRSIALGIKLGAVVDKV